MGGYFEPPPTHELNPREILSGCIEAGVSGVLLDQGSIPPAFFDLSSGLAGEVLHQLSKYDLRLACVVPDPTRHSMPFQAFLREANTGNAYRFFVTRAAAVQWLEAE